MSFRFSTFFIPLISITLILFLLGVFAFLAVGGQALADMAGETMEMKVIFEQQATDSTVAVIQKYIERKGYAERMKYSTKEDALKEFKALGEDVVEVMDGVNPLPSVLYLNLKPEYLNQEKIVAISKELRDNPNVKEIYFPLQFLGVADKIGQYQTIAAILGVLLFFASLFLIINTIRLAIFSKRLIIRTQQLVGATNAYIRQPFIQMGVLQGALGGFLASFSIYLTLTLISINLLPDLTILLERFEVKALFLGLVILGAGVGWFSASFAVNRFLNRSLDQLI